jgi:hypothetical protein
MPSIEITSAASGCAAEQLPDGSTVVVETATNTVHSLDPLAAAAFHASARTTDGIAREMGATLGRPVTENEALEAIVELERAGLVTSSVRPDATRRALLRAAGIAIPAVLTLTAAEQRAQAFVSGSFSAPPPPPFAP